MVMTAVTSPGFTSTTFTTTTFPLVFDFRPLQRRNGTLADLVAAVEELRAAFLEYEAAWL